MSHGAPEQEQRNAGPEGSLGEIIHEDYNCASRGGEMRDGVEAYKGMMMIAEKCNSHDQCGVRPE